MSEKTIKIALCDVRHRTRGQHAYQVPLAIGMVGAYALKTVTGAKVELRLYQSADTFLDEFRDWRPDIVGCSFYMWSRDLTLFLLSRVKDSLPGTITVLGGPELEMESDLRREFLETNPQIDVCVVGEGEDTFREIAELRVAGQDLRHLESLDGTFYLRPDGTLSEAPLRPKLVSLDEIPSPYLLGLFDDFFDDNLHPFMQTTRGCPFGCTFCHESLKMHQKVRFLSKERLAADLEYCAERFRDRHDVQLCLADSNFGMYPHNQGAAQEIRRVQDSHDWPRYINLSMGKNNKERIVKTSEILKWGLHLTMAVQSMNPDTLAAIDRKNISIDVMRESLTEGKNESEDSYSEFILNLPMETRESFEEGLRKCVDLDLNRIIVMTLTMLKGTPLATRESQARYDFGLKYRIIPRQFGKYEGHTVVETEEVVVSSNTMSLEDYLHLRELQFVIQVTFNSDHMNPIRRFLRENGVDVWEWLQRLHRFAKAADGAMGRQMAAYSREAEDELFPSREAIQEFAERDYQMLLDGERGDNLMNRYTVVANGEALRDWVGAAVRIGKELLLEKGIDESFVEAVMGDIEKFITMKYDFFQYFFDLPRPDQRTRMVFDHNIEAWMSRPGSRLDDWREPTTYQLWFTEDKVRHIHNTITKGHDISQTIQFVYRDRKFHAFMPEIEQIQAGERQAPAWNSC